MYVLPVEKACNAKCAFCITKFRETANKELLDISRLEEKLERFTLEKIEITGGGEPTLHPGIDHIIEKCSKKARTNMYTHGANLSRLTNLGALDVLCISIAHYDERKNGEIMGVSPELSVIDRVEVPVKFSLLLHKSGIHSKDEVIRYLDFAGKHADRVVMRQMFEHEYAKEMKDEFVSSQDMFEQLNVREYKMTAQGNPVFDYEKLQVEVEYRSCACEMDNPVLHADGKLHRGWSSELL